MRNSDERLDGVMTEEHEGETEEGREPEDEELGNDSECEFNELERLERDVNELEGQTEEMTTEDESDVDTKEEAKDDSKEDESLVI